MDVKLLIDAIVRQTTVLIAQLSTRAGIRAPLAHGAGKGGHRAAKAMFGFSLVYLFGHFAALVLDRAPGLVELLGR